MHIVRSLIGIVLGLLLGLALMPSVSAVAQERVDTLPELVDFTSARFDTQTIVQIGEQQQVAYGQGALIPADRSQLTIIDENSDQVINVIQVGTTIYLDTGQGWQRVDNLPFNSGPAVTIDEQIRQLADRADTILRVGDEQVRGVQTTHYQLWLSGADILAANEV